MVNPTQALRYIQAQLTLYTLLLFLCLQQNPYLQVTKANSKVDGYDSDAPITGAGNRRGRQNSDDSTASDATDPIQDLVNPQTLAQGDDPLIGPSAARALDKKNKKDGDQVEKKNDGSLNIRIHLDLHAKVRLDLEADLYGDIVIGLL
ncbi:hypothetical protein PENANT_c028G07767 [Penicillium antarcticum]|uniref:Uncharacterized protein n=1 Tax=Penicillium antarcticum TaxID=416450 RepID=A0A1V6PWB0_9EURO|nr:uncharacterized protein N7508_009022 [Penicillium antarcticum]KAJ5294201.1 hypothetical protein N7508_009022 [Penicillium antarcticum]OQD81304.1 hypothetical protein PENANT_c028G07767 [Penicillium antarcticum]